MKQAALPLPELGLIAATRGMAGAGVGLLTAGKMSDKKRKAFGWSLFLVGALSTIPLMMDVLKKTDSSKQ